MSANVFHGYCVTGLGEIEKSENIKWPESFCCVPRQGDLIRSECGEYQAYVEYVVHLVKSKNDWKPLFEIKIVGIHETRNKDK